MNEIMEYEKIDSKDTIAISENETALLIKDQYSSSYILKDKIASISHIRSENLNDKVILFGNYEDNAIIIETNNSLFGVFVADNITAEHLMQQLIRII